ncbi:hypothetical protein M514_10635 [Trichuris suis]|uniref:tRNA (cytosine(34)-C(5))-methyltransferase n=1 Tax=Trichuris suis TaxID=68888 RepID=A0A085NJP7_9BILA|nr:hypothetical protein M514_10635 [Trichuris suis]
MTKRKWKNVKDGPKKLRDGGSERIANQKPYEEVERRSEKFESYYKAQRVVPDNEWDTFMQCLKSDLPVTFRFVAGRKDSSVLLQKFRERFFQTLCESGIEATEATMKELEWYPDGLAFELNMDKKSFRRHPKFRQLHKFLVAETACGILSRQEAVSMIPPLFMDVKPAHYVLDTCAAPGSKTVQILEMLHSDESVPIPSGLVVANDSNNERCYLLVHQALKRSGSPCCVVTNMDAMTMPNTVILNESGDVVNMNFDRILCDVPCSGDGTLRKNINLWKEWNAVQAYGLHKLQLKIALRCAKLLKVGGLMVYSTCSMNPIEDEAVVATLIAQSHERLELMPTRHMLPKLIRCDGLFTWKVSDNSGTFYENHGQLPDHFKRKIPNTAFPPDLETAREMHLERCMRILPHHQNTGGFFVAVLRKVGEASIPPALRTEAITTSSEWKSVVKDKETPRKRKFAGRQEDPFVFIEKSDDTTASITDFYGMKGGFDHLPLLVRSSDVSKKANIYLVNNAAKSFITHNEDRIKIINAGLRIFGRSSAKAEACTFRLAQEGVHFLFPMITRRVVTITVPDLTKLLKTNENCLLKELSEDLQSALLPYGEGSIVFNCLMGELNIIVTGWRGKVSVVLYLDKETKLHYLYLLGEEGEESEPSTEGDSSVVPRGCASIDVENSNENKGENHSSQLRTSRSFPTRCSRCGRSPELWASVRSVMCCPLAVAALRSKPSPTIRKAGKKLYPFRLPKGMASTKESQSDSASCNTDDAVVVPKLGGGRLLQAVVVIDLLLKEEGLSARQMIWDELQALESLLDIKVQWIPFEKLGFGETSTLGSFYNADVVVVDVSNSLQQSTLCYHLGVRESMNQNYNIVLYAFDETFRERAPLHFKIPQNNYRTLLYALVDGALVAWSCTHVVFGVPWFGNAPTVNGGSQGKRSFRSQIKQMLNEVQIDASKHSKEKFLADLQIARQNYRGEKFNTVLNQLRSRLDDPDVLSVDTVVSMLLSYRDVQNYGAMVSMVEDVESLPQAKIFHSSAVQFHYAFALNRRNIGDDRNKALQVILSMLEKQENQIPDFLCLAGRIYKDRLYESKCQDRESLDEAIKWYRKGFEIQPNEYAGINLATLLVIAGESFQTCNELQQIAMILSGLLGRKGSLFNLLDYWDVATFFEISVLAENYINACQAASRMFELKPPAWFLKSTIGNIKLIKWYRESTRSAMDNCTQYQHFLFWMEFFVEYTRTEPVTSDIRFPVLSMEPSKVHVPSYVSVNEANNSISLWHVEDATVKANVNQWIFPAESIRAISASKSDERTVYLYVYLNSDDFTLILPTDFHRQRFLELASQVTSTTEGTKLLGDYTDLEPISYEFELDKDGNRTVLGKGTFGTVYSGRDFDSQRMIAIKELEVKNPEGVQPLVEEIQLHSTLKHVNIVQYLGCEVSEDQKVFRIFMELVPGGSLSLLLRNKWGPLIDNENSIAYYARQILQGLNYLHSQKIVHRDIKGDNVLVNTYSGLCKISDFGTCKRLAGLNPDAEGMTGTPQYMAPEVIEEGLRGYGAPADIWSFGCTMIEMATGKPPFFEFGLPEASMFKVGMFKVHPPIPEKLSNAAKSLILKCFEPDPSQRPTAAMLIMNSFFDKCRWRRYNEQPEVSAFSDASRHFGRSISYTTSSQEEKDESMQISSSLLSLNEILDERSPSEKGVSIPEAPGPSSRASFLRKESERREILSGIMRESENRIIELWLSSIQTGITGPIASEDVLRSLLVCLRDFIYDKDVAKLRKTGERIAELLGTDATSATQLHLAFYAFQDVMHSVLRRHRIRPHWMFTLDNLTRSSVQSIIEAILPEPKPLSSSDDDDANSSYSTVTSVDLSKKSNYGLHDGRVLISLLNDLRSELADFFASTKRSTIEFRKAVQSCQALLSAIASKISSPSNALTHPMDRAFGKARPGNVDEELVDWLRRIDIDEHSINILTREEYTLQNLLEMVTSREELLQLGIRGGVSCRIWKHIVMHRKKAAHDSCTLPGT